MLGGLMRPRLGQNESYDLSKSLYQVLEFSESVRPNEGCKEPRLCEPLFWNLSLLQEPQAWEQKGLAEIMNFFKIDF